MKILSSIFFFFCIISSFLFAQKSSRDNLLVHPIDEKICHSSFRTIFIGKENQEEKIREYLFSSIENLSAENVSLRLENKIESKTGIHFTFEQLYNGIKIFRSQIKVNMDHNANIKSVFDNTFEISEVTHDFNEFENVFSRLNISEISDDYKKELIYFPNEKKLIPALRLEIVKGDDYYEIIYNTIGKIIYKNDLNLYFSPPDSMVTATVFLPDPLTTAGEIYGTPYKDSSNTDVAELNAERKSVSFIAKYDTSANVFRLESPYVKINEHSSPVIQPATSTIPDFSFTRSQSGFEDANVFYHISTFHNYLQSLGFNNLVNYPINADAHALSGQDNSNFVSFFNPPRLNFGEGGVDDAEDADVIIHEYNHAVSYSAAPNTNFGTERSALDEALGDYFASSYSRSINNFKWENVFSWDGHNEFWPGRFSVSSDHYPDDLENNLYGDADIWSSTMMEIWADIGRENADALQVEALYSYASNMTMSDAAQLVIQADSALNNGMFYNQICNRFKNRGLVNSCGFFSIGINEKINSGDFIKLFNSENFISGGAAVIRFNKTNHAQIQLHDVSGKLILNDVVFTNEFFVEGKNLSKGVYFLSVITSENSETFKLLR